MNIDNSFLDSGSLICIGNNQLLIGQGLRTWSTLPQFSGPSRSINPSFYFPDFFLTAPNPWFTHVSSKEVSIDDLIHSIHALIPQTPHLKPKLDWQNTYQPHFAQTFADLQVRFTTDDPNKKLQKAVPFIFETVQQSMDKSLLAWALTHLLNYARTQPVYLYGYWDQNQGILGATPEILFSLEKDPNSSPSIIRTKAVAGTARSPEQLNQLLDNPKERHEHQLVIDGINTSLQYFGKVIHGTTSVLDLPGLAHLVTPIEVHIHRHLPPVDYEAAVRALHPTPALGASPKHVGQQWLNNYQTLIDRRRFGAPVGFQTHDMSQCYVAIRNIQWDRSSISIGAGCGVVPESQLNNEWHEIQAKICAIKNMMGL